MFRGRRTKKRTQNTTGKVKVSLLANAVGEMAGGADESKWRAGLRWLWLQEVNGGEQA